MVCQSYCLSTSPSCVFLWVTWRQVCSAPCGWSHPPYDSYMDNKRDIVPPQLVQQIESESISVPESLLNLRSDGVLQGGQGSSGPDSTSIEPLTCVYLNTGRRQTGNEFESSCTVWSKRYALPERPEIGFTSTSVRYDMRNSSVKCF